MLLLRRSDEAIERDIQPLIHLLEPRSIARRQLSRCQVFLLRGLNHLQAVLVRSRQEEHILAVKALKARQGIGRDRLIGVPDVWGAIWIGNRCGDVKRFGRAICSRFAIATVAKAFP